MRNVLVVFDGGTRESNPGKGYGSYQVSVDGAPFAIERFQIDRVVTSNEAEWLTLYEALLFAEVRVPNKSTVLIKGDSQLVINQINGVWQITMPHFRDLFHGCRSILNRFHSWSAMWHPRVESVKLFGH